MKQIALTQFMADYEDGLITEAVYVKDKVYGRSARGQGNNLKGYEIVYAIVP